MPKRRRKTPRKARREARREAPRKKPPKWTGKKREMSYINPKRLYAARVVLGITLRDVGREMDLSEWSLVKYVQRREWPVEHFDTLEDVFDMPGDWFRNPKDPRFVIERED